MYPGQTNFPTDFHTGLHYPTGGKWAIRKRTGDLMLILKILIGANLCPISKIPNSFMLEFSPFMNVHATRLKQTPSTHKKMLVDL